MPMLMFRNRRNLNSCARSQNFLVDLYGMNIGVVDFNFDFRIENKKRGYMIRTNAKCRT